MVWLALMMMSVISTEESVSLWLACGAVSMSGLVSVLPWTASVLEVGVGGGAGGGDGEQEQETGWSAILSTNPELRAVVSACEK